MQPTGRARLAAAWKMLGVAQGARILAQPRQRRAGVGGFERETLTQAAGEDRLAAVRPPRRIWSNSARPAPAAKIAAPGSAVCGRAQRGRACIGSSFAVPGASARRARGRGAAETGSSVEIESSECMGRIRSRRRRFVTCFRALSAGLVCAL